MMQEIIFNFGMEYLEYGMIKLHAKYPNSKAQELIKYYFEFDIFPHHKFKLHSELYKRDTIYTMKYRKKMPLMGKQAIYLARRNESIY